MEKREPVGADDLLEGKPKRMQQILFIARPGHGIKEMTDEVSQHLRVGFRTEAMTLTQELILQRLKILDYPVMDERQFPALIQMRMRVFIRNPPMSRPPGVSNPSCTVRRILLNQLR